MRTKRIETRVDQEEMEGIAAAAKARGLSVAAFARWAMLLVVAKNPAKQTHFHAFSPEGLSEAFTKRLRQAAEEGE